MVAESLYQGSGDADHIAINIGRTIPNPFGKATLNIGPSASAALALTEYCVNERLGKVRVILCLNIQLILTRLEVYYLVFVFFFVFVFIVIIVIIDDHGPLPLQRVGSRWR